MNLRRDKNFHLLRTLPALALPSWRWVETQVSCGASVFRQRRDAMQPGA